MRFTDAHSASTVSSPSRYSLLTGHYHWRGHLTEGIVSQWGDPAIEKGRPRSVRAPYWQFRCFSAGSYNSSRSQRSFCFEER